MKLIIGLGNLGAKYKNNRHNIGHTVIDFLKTKNLNKNIKLLKTNCFMNDSGIFVQKTVGKYKPYIINDLYIIHDDLDIPLGLYKIQFAKGPKDHNGLNDIYEKLRTKEFWHIRVGIDNRIKDVGNRVSGEEYTLNDFTKGEKIVLDKVMNEICKKLAIL